MRRGRKQTRTSIFPKLQSEINQKGMSLMYIADASGLEIHNLQNKIYGKYDLKLWEAIAIKEAVMSDLPLEELFSTT
jgi:hypothetical protein